jgi:hypothetical protein
MDENQVRSEVVKFFEVVAPLSRRIVTSKSVKVPKPAFVLRDDRRDAWDRKPHEAITQWLTQERGTQFRYGERAPMNVGGAVGCYSPELNLIWVDSRSDDERKLAVIAHETAHALTYDTLNRNQPKGVWARSLQHERAYSVGEIVAESVSFVVTRQVLHHTTAHSALYVAEYAARERDVVGALATALPLTTEAALAMIRAMECE